MSGKLTVGTSETTVLTTDLEQFAQCLEVVASELSESARRLARADRFVTHGELLRTDAPYSAILAEEAIDAAQLAASDALASSELITTGLRFVIENYESTEQQLARAHEGLAAHVGYGLGWLLPSIALLAAPIVLPGLAGAALGLLLMPADQRQRLVQGVLALAHAKAGILTDPVTVELVRQTVTSADDFMAGLAHVPPGVAFLAGDEGLDLTGLATSAAIVGGAAGAFGLLRESPVDVKPVSVTGNTTPATGIKDRIERIPSGDEQIRIDRYESPGKPDRVEVYIAGTAALGGVTGPEPWDMGSNLQAVAGGSPGSLRSVEAAMALAGVTPETPVVFTGYSQGGLIAAQLAASGDWNTAALVTVGAPAGQVAVPHGVDYLAIEHTDDIVPALGGRFEQSAPLVVRREVFDGAVDTSERLLPAHELSNYVLTAELVDAEPDARIRSIVDRLGGDGYRVTSTMYRADRIS